MAGALVPRRGRRGGQAAEKSATITRGARQTVYVKGSDGQPQAIGYLGRMCASFSAAM